MFFASSSPYFSSCAREYSRAGSTASPHLWRKNAPEARMTWSYRRLFRRDGGRTLLRLGGRMSFEFPIWMPAGFRLGQPGTRYVGPSSISVRLKLVKINKSIAFRQQNFHAPPTNRIIFPSDARGEDRFAFCACARKSWSGLVKFLSPHQSGGCVSHYCWRKLDT